MGSVLERIKLSNTANKKELIDYGFVFRHPNKFVYRIPAYKYKDKMALIFLEFTIDLNDNNKYIYINCTKRDGSMYAPFYNQKYITKNYVLDEVKRKLKRTISDMYKNNITITKVKRRKKKEE